MTGIDELYADLRCEICEDNDHCLPRWEDDGGGAGWPASPAQAFERYPERDRERDHGHRDRQPDEQPDRPI